MKPLLPPRQHLFLTMADEHTVWEGNERPGRVLINYWMPKRRDYSEILGQHISIYGSGDRAVLKALVRRGLLKQRHRDRDEYEITEDGMLVLSRLDTADLEQFRDRCSESTPCGRAGCANCRDITDAGGGAV